VSSYVTSLNLAVAPQSGIKDHFYCTVYGITFNSNCEAQNEPKKYIKLAEVPGIARDQM
jgi:hypothetical protein